MNSKLSFKEQYNVAIAGFQTSFGKKTNVKLTSLNMIYFKIGQILFGINCLIAISVLMLLLVVPNNIFILLSFVLIFIAVISEKMYNKTIDSEYTWKNFK